ncbi:MAG: L,D-transpeptidase family protein [Clostridium sp.]|uniref:L,D-transpeptidase family protein n=1 Tax=Clostridium sp. TaxID=1506 RepID=UPI003D6D5AC8
MKNQISSINQSKLATPSATATPKTDLLIDRINGKGNAKQAIVVTTNGFGSVNATITTFENINGNWKQIHSLAGNVGRTGFTSNKVEGDGHSPIGVFSLGTAFGRYSNPGTAMDYRQSTPNDFWADDLNSPLYNTWQEGPANGRWNSAEKMYIPQYNYGFVINYNTANIIPGKGSAIFFHVWSGSGQGTAGCIATAQYNVISILKWLNPSRHPVIIQGPMSEVTKI